MWNLPFDALQMETENFSQISLKKINLVLSQQEMQLLTGAQGFGGCFWLPFEFKTILLCSSFISTPKGFLSAWNESKANLLQLHSPPPLLPCRFLLLFLPPGRRWCKLLITGWALGNREKGGGNQIPSLQVSIMSVCQFPWQFWSLKCGCLWRMEFCGRSATQSECLIVTLWIIWSCLKLTISSKDLMQI